jgi:hypothetical protein
MSNQQVLFKTYCCHKRDHLLKHMMCFQVAHHLLLISVRLHSFTIILSLSLSFSWDLKFTMNGFTHLLQRVVFSCSVAYCCSQYSLSLFININIYSYHLPRQMTSQTKAKQYFATSTHNTFISKINKLEYIIEIIECLRTSLGNV